MTERQIEQTEFESYIETEVVNVSRTQLESWHQAAVWVARGYRRCEYRLVVLLKNISQCEGYYQYGCDSLTRYARFCLDLPENTIRDFVTVANKANEIPRLIEVLRLNQATVSKLRKICPVLNSENQDYWLDLARNCTTRELERAVAMQKPETAVEDRRVHVGPDLIELRVGLSEEVMELIERVQDLVCSKNSSQSGYAETLRVMAEIALEKLDPVRKAQAAQKRNNRGTGVQAKGEKETSGSVKQAVSGAARDASIARPRQRRRLTARQVHQVQLRDQSRCTHNLPDGTRCTNRRWLHIHHIHPVSEGGANVLENLELVCSSHHRMHHRTESSAGRIPEQ